MGSDPNDDFVACMQALLHRADNRTGQALRRFLLRAARGEAERHAICSLLTAMSLRTPEPALAEILVRVIEETALTEPCLAQDWNAVNIVGTGGGLPSFNISTTAAIIAAATGLRVLKSGSAAYSSNVGAVDFLRASGIAMVQDVAQAQEMLDRFGIAFYMPGTFSPLLKRLAMAAAPFPLKSVAPVLNRIGPFLRLLPSSGQLTGVARASDLGWYREVFGRLGPRNVHLVANPLGLDEACSFSVNELWSLDSDRIRRLGCDLGLSAGEPADIRGGDLDANLAISRAILAGNGPPAATDCVLLNAALLICTAAGPDRLGHALTEARHALSTGAAQALFTALSATGDVAARAS
ncbi:anthranilate phosphoribosyltransferase [Paracoccus sp. (in: a-proteobacteria)]|uniref:anthranilate phosphoribosyltransferase n=1 Tax=Paracoccus sp. TaxID=267 RepID=UPI003A8B91A4